LDLNSLRRFAVTDNPPETTGRLVALDLGAKRVGVAVSDELQIAATPLPFVARRSWKDLLRRVAAIIEGYDARGLVIGLPLGLDGRDGEAAQEARRLAENFRRSLNVPVYLQDERLTTFAAGEQLKSTCFSRGRSRCTARWNWSMTLELSRWSPFGDLARRRQNWPRHICFPFLLLLLVTPGDTWCHAGKTPAAARLIFMGQFRYRCG